MLSQTGLRRQINQFPCQSPMILGHSRTPRLTHHLPTSAHHTHQSCDDIFLHFLYVVPDKHAQKTVIVLSNISKMHTTQAHTLQQLIAMPLFCSKALALLSPFSCARDTQQRRLLCFLLSHRKKISRRYSDPYKAAS